MTETTTRLRWESLSNGDALGYVTPGQWLYEICKPSDDADDDELELRSRLPGQTGDRWQGTDRGELEGEAEEMLAQFVTSLGAAFPAGSSDENGQDEGGQPAPPAKRPVLTSMYVFDVLCSAGFTPWGSGEPGFTTGWHGDAITVDHVGADLPVHGPLEGPRAIIAMGNLRERLARISGWHERETGPAGTVGDYCTECGNRWPCDTRRMADGIYTDPED